MENKAYRSSSIEYDYDPWSMREKLTLGSIMLYLLFVPWAFGGIQNWAIIGTGIIGLIMLLIPIIPLPYMGRNGSVNSTVSENLKAFAKSPVFWCGFLLIAYISVQALNPGFKCIGYNNDYIMEALNPIKWLPSGYSAPFRSNNSWKYLLYMFPAWVCVSVICTQLKRKRIQTLIWFQVINVLLFATIALLQDQTNSHYILWYFPPIKGVSYWGTVVNPNMAVAYMNLGLALCAFLFIKEFRKQASERLTGGPYLFLLPAYAVILASVIMAYCRAGIVISLVITMLFAASMFIYVTFIMKDRVIRVALGIITVIIFIVGISMASMVSIQRLETEWLKTKREASNLESNLRTALYDTSSDMLKDNWLIGRGAGSYRYYFKQYAQEYPAFIYKKRLADKSYEKRVRLSFYAHNDFQQYIIELGIIGTAILLLPVFIFLFLYVKNYRYMQIEYAFFLLAILACIVHCAIDYVYSHPLGLSMIFFSFYSISQSFKLRKTQSN